MSIQWTHNVVSASGLLQGTRQLSCILNKSCCRIKSAFKLLHGTAYLITNDCMIVVACQCSMHTARLATVLFCELCMHAVATVLTQQVALDPATPYWAVGKRCSKGQDGESLCQSNLVRGQSDACLRFETDLTAPTSVSRTPFCIWKGR